MSVAKWQAVGYIRGPPVAGAARLAMPVLGKSSVMGFSAIIRKINSLWRGYKKERMSV